jgi:hypothetical protein
LGSSEKGTFSRNNPEKVPFSALFFSTFENYRKNAIFLEISQKKCLFLSYFSELLGSSEKTYFFWEFPEKCAFFGPMFLNF